MDKPPFLTNPKTKYTYKANEFFNTTEYDNYTFIVWDSNDTAPKPCPYSFDEALNPVMDDGEFEYEGISGTKTAFRVLKENVDGWTIEKTADVCCLNADKIEEGYQDLYRWLATRGRRTWRGDRPIRIVGAGRHGRHDHRHPNAQR